MVGLSEMDWTPDDTTLNLIRHVALQNVLEYEGKAAVGSVIGQIMGMRDDLKRHGKAVWAWSLRSGPSQHHGE